MTKFKMLANTIISLVALIINGTVAVPGPEAANQANRPLT
jgi:hypothetical protein